MADWYLAPSLHVGRSEVDALWPNRDRTSDGTIGDPAHQARSSDHNPNTRGSVDAWDMDTNGPDVEAVKRAFEAHPSAHYWIHNRRIADADNDWRPLYYSGTNPHTGHVHFSIRQTATAENDIRAWRVASHVEETVTPEEIRAEVIAGQANFWDQVANRSTPTGRQAADDFNVAVRNAIAPVTRDLVASFQALLAQSPAFSSQAFVEALALSPDSLNALTLAMRDQLPLIPTAQEIAKAIIVLISAGVHNGQS